jgi:starch synthase
MLRVLTVIIVPPHLSVSGGAGAGERLSDALTPYCHMTVASMLNGIGERTGPSGSARAYRISVRTWLPPGLPWSKMPNKYKTLFYRSDIPEIIAAGKYDLVHIHNPLPTLEMERAAMTCRKLGIPYVVSTHGFNEVENGPRVYGFNAFQRQIWRHCVVQPLHHVLGHAQAVFALTPADYEFVRRMGFEGQELVVVSNGVSEPRPADLRTDETALRRCGIPIERTNGQVTCMFLANHTPNKGLPFLLSVFTQLDFPYLLIVAGDKRSEIDYEGYIARCRPGQRIIVTGHLNDNEVDACFRRSDLFVFPTLAETFGIVILEAMSHGLPVIASRVGGIPYFLADDCGVLIDAGNSQQLKRAVETLASNPRMLRAMGQRGRLQASKYTWENAAAVAAEAYHRILKAQNPRPTRPPCSLVSGN